MALEDSMNNLAEAMNKYAAVMSRHCDLTERALNAGATSVKVTGPGESQETTDTPPAEKKTRGRPKKTDKTDTKTDDSNNDADAFGAGEGEEDPFGDAAPAATPKLDTAVIRGLVMRVKEAKGDDTALKLLAKVGAKTLAGIPEEKYQEVVDLAKKVGVTL